MQFCISYSINHFELACCLENTYSMDPTFVYHLLTFFSKKKSGTLSECPRLYC